MPRGVLVLRHTPDPLDQRIACHETFGFVHVRAITEHAYIDELETEVLGDREMAVVAWHHTEELELPLFPLPRGLGPQRTPEPRAQQVLVHEGQTRVPTCNDLRLLNTKQRRSQTSGTEDSVKPAIVPHIGPIRQDIVIDELAVEAIRQGQLLRTGFPACQVEGQPDALELSESSRELTLV